MSAQGMCSTTSDFFFCLACMVLEKKFILCSHFNVTLHCVENSDMKECMLNLLGTGDFSTTSD